MDKFFIIMLMDVVTRDPFLNAEWTIKKGTVLDARWDDNPNGCWAWNVDNSTWLNNKREGKEQFQVVESPGACFCPTCGHIVDGLDAENLGEHYYCYNGAWDAVHDNNG